MPWDKPQPSREVSVAFELAISCANASTSSAVIMPTRGMVLQPLCCCSLHRQLLQLRGLGLDPLRLLDNLVDKILTFLADQRG